MIAEEHHLLAAICANPGDDTPRLVYADWLEENGQHDRAEFIRVQCELARLPDVCEEPGGVVFPIEYTPVPFRDQEPIRSILAKRKALRRRERELWNYGEPGAWVVSIKPLVDCIQCIEEETISQGRAYDPILVFRRGFVFRVTCTAEDWLTHADQIYWHPEQTVECPNCEGEGTVGRDSGWLGPCPDCGGQWEPVSDETDRGYSPGTGRVPRPFVATAQPLERVTLTSIPDDQFFRLANDFSVAHIDGQSVWTSPRWPGIEFTLPHDPTYEVFEHDPTYEVFEADFLAMTDEMRRQIMLAMGLPPGLTMPGRG